MEEDQVYQFVGEGLGVPGLPHTISLSEAKHAGLLEILQAAIDNGNYVLAEYPPIMEV